MTPDSCQKYLRGAALIAAFALASPAAAEDGRYIVRFNPGKSASGRAAIAAVGGQIVLELRPQNAAAALLPAQAVDALRANPNIEYVEDDARRYPLAQTVPYGIPMVQADLVTHADASAKRVCIIDSGYYGSHDDLQDGNVTATTDSGTGDPFVDGCGHGSHVAGTVAALDNTVGVVGTVRSGALKLHIVKVFGNDCAWAYSSSLVDALNKCTAAGSNVVSMSLGGSFSSRTEDSAFADANSKGVLSIAAAGNGGNTRKSYPASYESVMSVAAIDSTKTVASFSQKNDAVDIAAPGVGVLSTVPWKGANLTEGGVTYLAAGIANSLTTEGESGALADGGICDTAGSWTGKVVLCQRGTISFKQKLDNVLAGGGIAGAIYNNVSGGFAGTCDDGTGTSCDIVGISLSQEDGQHLVASRLDQTATVVNSTAPGSGYEAWDGTSMATPHVSGVAALVWSNFPAKTNADIRNALESTAEDLGAAGKDTSYGWGLVQAKAAYDKLAGSGGDCTPTTEDCSDGIDNDCDGLIDSADEDCPGDSCLAAGSACTSNSECCSGSCKGKPGAKKCK